MLRNVDEWDDQFFAFHPGDAVPAVATTVVAVDGGSGSPTVTIDDADFLFHAEFKRAGSDLILSGDGRMVIVRDYFAAEQRATLLSGEGAALSPRVVEALAGPLAPGQYAQAGGAQGTVQAVGRVAKVDGDVVVVRNGVAVTVKVGDPILKGDVLQTRSGQLGVTFNDGSTINLTENARLVVNEFVYDPNGSANSQILDLVQGSLTFISGEVAHTGDMQIGTPVATMGIRGTVGGVTGAETDQVSFFIVQSDRGAVLTDSNGTVIAQVVQNGPLVVVRPVGPLQVLAEEVQKSPQQLAAELAALQHIVSVQAVGQQIIQQFLNPNQDPNNPQAKGTDHTQIQIDIPKSAILPEDGDGDGNNTVTVTVITNNNDNNNDDNTNDNTNNLPEHFTIDLPANLPPIVFAPFAAALQTDEDNPLTFFGQTAISVFDKDTAILTVTLSATLGTLTLGGVSGLSFAAGDGTNDAIMTFTGTHATINAALNGLTFTPTPDESGQGSVVVTVSDGEKTITHALDITINPVNDVPVIGGTTVGTVTEDDDPTTLSTGGALTIDDPDEGESNFVPQMGTFGSYGTFTLDADGNWVYAADNTQAAIQGLGAGDTLTDSFTAFSSDGTATQLVTVTIVGTNDAPVVNTGLPAAVSEEGLPGGLPDSEGAPDTTDEVIATGTITATDAEGDELTFALGRPTLPLTSGGVNICWELSETGTTLTGKAGANTVITIELNGQTGAYSVTLSGPIDHGVESIEDIFIIPVPVSVSDGQSTTTVSMAVQVEDDSPVAADHVKTVSVAVQNFNIAFVLDFSGSISNAELNTMLNAVKDAGQSLFDEASGRVEITLIAFATGAVTLGTFDNFSDFQGAIDAVNSDVDGTRPPGIGSGTNFTEAIQETMTGFAPKDGTKNEVFFVSDGQSSLQQETADEWVSFVQEHDIGVTAIGIGDGVSIQGLQAIDTSGAPIAIAEFDDLIATLLSTLGNSVSGNIFTDIAGAADFGADGGRIFSVTVDGDIYTSEESSISVETASGGHFVFHFVAANGHQAGDWSYSLAGQGGQPIEDIFHYVLIDNDGDTAGGSISFNLPPAINALNLEVTDEPNSNDTKVTGIQISDPDAGEALLVLTATVAHGTLTFLGDQLGSFPSSDEIWATLDDINGAFESGFLYKPTLSNPDDPDSLPETDNITLTIQDNHGASDSLTFVFSVPDQPSGDVKLTGTPGKDYIFATGNNDTLAGEGGSDTFVFAAEDIGGHDHIVGFDVADDFLLFSRSVFDDVSEVLAAAVGDEQGTTLIANDNDLMITLDGIPISEFQNIDHSHILLVA